MQNVYINIGEYNLSKKCDVLKVFDDMITDMISNKKLSLITERNLNISTVFIIQCYFEVPKVVRLI